MNFFKKQADKKEDAVSDLSKVVSRETLTLPIVKANSKKSLTLPDCELKADKMQISDYDEKLEFTPKYILQGNASSISELKEIIAKSKPPKLSFIINGDLSAFSQNEKEQIDKINSFDIDKVLAKIRRKNEDMEKIQMQTNDEKTQSEPLHKYKISSVSVKLQKKDGKPTDFTSVNETQKYLTADEIIAKRRSEQEEKRLKTAAFLASKDENKSISAMAKLYYQSDIKKHKE